jgi:uncharacterized protein (TIGR03437 family)
MNCTQRFCLGLLALVWGTLPASAQSIASLKVTGATSKRVDLAWSGTGASYTVQRRVLGGTYSPLATVTNSTYSDTTVDPYTTYDYQVTAGSAASNAVTVGPPPAGLSNAAPAPLLGSTPADDYGYNISLALDGNGDPAFLFGWVDPNGDTDPSDGQLLFRSWSRAQYAWNAPVKVATVGDAFTTFTAMDSLAYDASTGAWAAAYKDSDDNVNVYVSTDGGATWTKKKTYAAGSSGPTWRGPSLGLAGGNLYLALLDDTGGALHYVTGKLSADASTWTDQTAPKVSGVKLNVSEAVSLALDSAASPGIAWWGSQGDNLTLLFWRPAGGGAPVKVLDAQNNYTEDPAVKLVYYGLNPRVLVYLIRNDSADSDDGIHVARSDDGGLTWQTPVMIPPDGTSSTDYPADLTFDSKGDAAVAFGENEGSGDSACGNPKLSRSTDLVHWTTCAIAGTDVTGDFGSYPGSIQIAYGGNDKLYLLWWEQGDTQANTGVLMYREPPATAISGPSISDVVDGASFRPNIVGGSWVTIRGVNLSDATRTWSGSDFTDGNNLPTALSGVSVKINGLPAAVYYISPTQINVQAPANLSGSVGVQVTHSGAASNTATATAAAAAPALFTYTAGTKTYPAAVYLNSLIVGDPALSGTAVSKAHAGDTILLFATGLAPSTAGTIIQSPVVVQNPVTVTIGGQNAAVGFAGLVASGEFQINVTVPGLAPGEYPVTVQVAGQSSQSGVVIPIGQ